jgi:sirohydrochlorin ferrochelatase
MPRRDLPDDVARRTHDTLESLDEKGVGERARGLHAEALADAQRAFSGRTADSELDESVRAFGLLVLELEHSRAIVEAAVAGRAKALREAREGADEIEDPALRNAVVKLLRKWSDRVPLRVGR